MGRRIAVVSVIGLIAILAQSAFAADTASKEPGKPAVISVKASVEKIHILAVDQAKRTVKIKASDGQVANYKVGKEVRNLAQVKDGDVLTAKEMERLAIYARQGKDKPAIKESYSFSRAPKGAKPGFVATQHVELTGKVQLVQYDKRKVVVTGPAGKSKSFDVAPDVKNLKQLKPGDVVVVDYTDSMSMAVATPKK